MRFIVVSPSSRWAFNASSSARYVDRSARKDLMRSVAFSVLDGLSSCLARSAYWSIVREKEVRDAEIWPCKEGGVVVGEEAKRSRSRRMEEDCLSAELKVEFWGDGA